MGGVVEGLELVLILGVMSGRGTLGKVGAGGKEKLRDLRAPSCSAKEGAVRDMAN